MTNNQYAELSLDALISLVKRAISEGRLELLSEILNTCKSPDLRGLAVAFAAKSGHLEIIQELLKKSSISQEYRGEAVINAVTRGHLKVVQELLKNNAPITQEAWKSALRYAVENEHFDIVHALEGNVPLTSHFKV
jgi:Ankyrin repeats (3 copies)